MPDQKPSKVLPLTVYDDDTVLRRAPTRQEHKDFVHRKIVFCILEFFFDLYLVYDIEHDIDYQNTNVYGSKATWLIFFICCSLVSYVFKIIMSSYEICSYDDEGIRYWSDSSVLLSLLIDVLKSFVNMLFVVEHMKLVNMLKALFVIIIKSFERQGALTHHFRGWNMCGIPIYVIGAILETCFAVWAMFAYLRSWF